MNSKAHSENPLKRVQEFFFSSKLYGFQLLASEFIPRRVSNVAESVSSDRGYAPQPFANSIPQVFGRQFSELNFQLPDRLITPSQPACFVIDAIAEGEILAAELQRKFGGIAK
jgi:hypothetical protein